MFPALSQGEGIRGADLIIPSKFAPHVKVEGDRLIVDVPKDLPGRERTCWYATLPLDLSDCAQQVPLPEVVPEREHLSLTG